MAIYLHVLALHCKCYSSQRQIDGNLTVFLWCMQDRKLIRLNGVFRSSASGDCSVETEHAHRPERTSPDGPAKTLVKPALFIHERSPRRGMDMFTL